MVFLGCVACASAIGDGPELALLVGWLGLGCALWCSLRLQGCVVLLQATLLLLMFAPLLTPIRDGRPYEVRVRSQLKNLSQALAEYHEDHGAYPEPTIGGHSSVLYQTLGGLEGRKLYYEFKEDAMDNEDSVLDVWQQPITYHQLGEGVLLMSRGGDGDRILLELHPARVSRPPR